MNSSVKTLTLSIEQAIEGAEEVRDYIASELDEDHPRLLVQYASPHRTVAKMRDILAAAGNLYNRGTPVRLYRETDGAATRVQHLRADDLVLQAHQVCRPYAIKRDKHGEPREEDVRLPRSFAEMYLGWHGEWRLPVLNGIASSPLLREDGSIHARTGYDPTTGMWCESVPDICGILPDRPIHSDAVAALRTLRRAFRTLCFADATMIYDKDLGVDVVDLDVAPGLDESTFLAALLTAVCRPSLTHAPGIVVRGAPISGAGAGKGLAVRCIAIVAFGREPNAVSGGFSREELEKRIGAELLEASPVLFLDNLNNRTFKSDLLASVITERPTRVRLLGRSQMLPLNPSALVVLTGNGLLLSEDLARRFIAIELDPRTEDPEARPFRRDIKRDCHDNRASLLGALLTIWRWGRHCLNLPSGVPFGGFERWSHWVRDPLLALGCKDPVARVSETKSRDSERETIREIFAAWWHHHSARAVALRELNDEVRHALDPAGRGRQWMSARVEKLAGTRYGGWMLKRQPAASKSGVVVYVLNRTESPERHQDHRDHQGAIPQGNAPSRPDDLDGLDGFGREPDADRAATSTNGTRSDVSQDVGRPEKHQDHRDHQGPLKRGNAPSDPDGLHGLDGFTAAADVRSTQIPATDAPASDARGEPKPKWWGRV